MQPPAPSISSRAERRDWDHADHSCTTNALGSSVMRSSASICRAFSVLQLGSPLLQRPTSNNENFRIAKPYSAEVMHAKPLLRKPDHAFPTRPNRAYCGQHTSPPCCPPACMNGDKVGSSDSDPHDQKTIIDLHVVFIMRKPSKWVHIGFVIVQSARQRLTSWLVHPSSGRH